MEPEAIESIFYFEMACGFVCSDAAIKSPRDERDLFMYCASFKQSPVTSGLSILLLPARSTNLGQL